MILEVLEKPSHKINHIKIIPYITHIKDATEFQTQTNYIIGERNLVVSVKKLYLFFFVVEIVSHLI